MRLPVPAMRDWIAAVQCKAVKQAFQKTLATSGIQCPRMATTTSSAGEHSNLRVFEVQRSDLTVQINFVRPFWELVHNIPTMYSALLEQMGQFGVGTQNMRSDNGDGTLGGYNVSFWMFDFRVVVRIRLHSAEFQVVNFTRPEVDVFERAVQLAVALRSAHRDLEFASYAVTSNVHGQIAGVDAREHLSTFVRNVPEGLGPYTRSGVSFHFGQRGPRRAASVTGDLSELLPGALFVKLYSVFDGAVAPDALRRIIEEEIGLDLHGLGLTTQAV